MANDDEEIGGEEKKPSRFSIWFEEQWDGWLKSTGGILLLVAAYAVYKMDLVGENFAGAFAAVAVVVGSIALTAWPAWPMMAAKKPWSKALFGTMLGLWLVGAGWPVFRCAVPPAALASATLTQAQPKATLKTGAVGPYELVVSGGFKSPGMAEQEIGYSLKVEGGGNADDISGGLARKRVQVRVGRRGGTATSIHEQTESSHPLPTARGGELTITAESVDAELADGLHVAVRAAGPNAILFIVLAALAVILAIGFDSRLVDAKGKEKAYLAAGAGTALAFSIAFPIERMEGTPIVKAAVSAFVLALLIGGGGGWIFGVLGRLAAGPKIKKAKR
jgi:hypothetical protein